MKEFLNYLLMKCKAVLAIDIKQTLKRFFITDKAEKEYKPYNDISIYTREIILMGLIFGMSLALFYGTNGSIYTFPLVEGDAIYEAINGDQTETYEELVEAFEQRQKEGAPKLNINTATKKELMSLEGIGERLSERILDYRYENDGFNSIYDLLEIEGISQAKLIKIKDKITV